MGIGGCSQSKSGGVVEGGRSGGWATMKIFCSILCIIGIIMFASFTCKYALFTTYEKAFGFSATEMSGKSL